MITQQEINEEGGLIDSFHTFSAPLYIGFKTHRIISGKEADEIKNTIKFKTRRWLSGKEGFKVKWPDGHESFIYGYLMEL